MLKNNKIEWCSFFRPYMLLLYLFYSLILFSSDSACGSETIDKIESSKELKIPMVSEFMPFSLIESGFSKTESPKKLDEKFLLSREKYVKGSEEGKKESLNEFLQYAKYGNSNSMSMLGYHFKKSNDLKRAFHWYVVQFIKNLQDNTSYDVSLKNIEGLKDKDYDPASIFSTAIKNLLRPEQKITPENILNLYFLNFLKKIETISSDVFTRSDKNIVNFELFKNSQIIFKKCMSDNKDIFLSAFKNRTYPALSELMGNCFFEIGVKILRGEIGTKDPEKPNYKMGEMFIKETGGYRELDEHYSWALTRLGQAHYFGWLDGKKNEVKAEEYFKKAATPLAYEKLAAIYEENNNFYEAEKYFRKANTKSANSNLGVMYLNKKIGENENYFENAKKCFKASDTLEARLHLAQTYILESVEHYKNKKHLECAENLKIAGGIFKKLKLSSEKNSKFYFDILYYEAWHSWNCYNYCAGGETSLKDAQGLLEKVNSLESKSFLADINYKLATILVSADSLEEKLTYYSKKIKLLETSTTLLNEVLLMGSNKPEEFSQNVKKRLNRLVKYSEATQKEFGQIQLESDEINRKNVIKKALDNNLQLEQIVDASLDNNNNEEPSISKDIVENKEIFPNKKVKTKKLSIEELKQLKEQKIELEKKISEKMREMYAEKLSQIQSQEEPEKEVEILFISKEVEKEFNKHVDEKSPTQNKINTILGSIKRDGVSDVGKFEALTGNLKGWFSLRITQGDRFIYCIRNGKIYIGECGGHYTNDQELERVMKEIKKI